MKERYKVIDLFAGSGGFSEAFKSYDKYKTVFANDICKESQMIYKANHKNVDFILKDINTLSPQDIPEHDILCAGFPCQPFSIAGQLKGFEDPRANVFWKILEIIEHRKPRVVFLENVKNLTTHDKGTTLEKIINSLKQHGYHVLYKIMDAKDVTGIPQHRERIYIICFKHQKDYDKFTFDYDKKDVTDIRSYLIDKVDDKYYYSDKYKIYECIKNSIEKHISTNTMYQYRRYYVRENKSKVCPTLTANMGTGGHNVPLLLDDNGIRKLTPKECFNLQGFPVSYKLPKISDNKLYKLAGNAVSVPVIEHIISKLDCAFI